MIAAGVKIFEYICIADVAVPPKVKVLLVISIVSVVFGIGYTNTFIICFTLLLAITLIFNVVQKSTFVGTSFVGCFQFPKVFAYKICSIVMATPGEFSERNLGISPENYYLKIDILYH